MGLMGKLVDKVGDKLSLDDEHEKIPEKNPGNFYFIDYLSI